MSNKQIIDFFMQNNLMIIYIVGVVLVARLFLQKISSTFAYRLWIVAFISMLVPVNLIQGEFSLIPKKVVQIEVPETYFVHETIENAGLNHVSETEQKNTLPSENITDSYNIKVTDSKRSNYLYIGAAIWLIVALGIFLFEILQYVKLRCGLKKSEIVSCDKVRRIKVINGINTPFVFGIIKPYIYLPDFLEPGEENYITKHEDYHRKRCDHILRLIVLCVCVLYWYNPFVWLGFYYFCVDMELSCDERVIANSEGNIKKSYAESLLKYSAANSRFYVMSLTFGEPGIKYRIKNVLKYKKKNIYITMLAVIILVVLGIGLFIKPEKNYDIPSVSHTAAPSQQPSVSPDKEIKQELGMADIIQMTYEERLAEYDYNACSNSTVSEDDKGALNYYVNFDLPYNERMFRLFVSYMKADDNIDMIYLVAEDDSMCVLYDDGMKKTKDELITFLASKVSIEDYILSVELPEGYSMGSYNANIGSDGGAIIGPVAYDVYKEYSSAPQEWYSAGFFSVIKPDISKTETDTKWMLNWVRDNHTSYEVIDKPGGFNKAAYLLKVYHDLYTSAGIGEMKAQGIDTDNIDTTSVYWYVIIEDEKTNGAYCLALSEKHFSKERAVYIAKTMHFAR